MNPSVKRKAPPRKASPGRQENDQEESTFNEKLAEIKKLRSAGVRTNVNTIPPVQRSAREEPVVPKQVKTATGVKTFLKSFESWIEVVSSSGKIYYYNKKTRENQWKKPQEWIDEEMRLNPPIPPEPELPPAPILPEEIPLPAPKPEAPKLTMKIKTKKKVNKLKKKVSKLPAAYQPRPEKKANEESDDEDSKPNASKLTLENAFEKVDEDEKPANLPKLDKKDELGHVNLKIEENGSKTESEKANGNAVKEEKEVKKEKPVEEFKLDLSLPGMERLRSKGSAAQQAFQNLSKVPESKLIYGEDSGSMISTGKVTGNPTFFTEYNIPCCLSRCKFPKEQDVLAELKINKLKKRNYHPVVQYDNPELARLAREAELDQFYIELKNYNNHDRLLTSRLEGTFVYKVVDEIWDRYFHKFQIKILDGIYLECKPSGYSHKDELVYSRTGKNCGFKTFPEDLVRCQAVLQAWNKEYCLVVYANKIFRVDRDDRQWDRDMQEIKRFLTKNGY